MLYMTHIDGKNYRLFLTFENDHHKDMWESAIRKIKHSNENILSASNQGATDETIKVMAIHFLALCLNLHTTYGPERVPLDIRRAIHDFEDHLQLTRTDFGTDHGIYPDRNDEQP